MEDYIIKELRIDIEQLGLNIDKLRHHYIECGKSIEIWEKKKQLLIERADKLEKR